MSAFLCYNPRLRILLLFLSKRKDRKIWPVMFPWLFIAMVLSARVASGPQTLQGPELLWDDRGRVEDSTVISWEFGPTVSAPAAFSSVTARTHYSHLSKYQALLSPPPATRLFLLHFLFIQFWLKWKKNKKKPNSDLLWNLTKYGFFFFFLLMMSVSFFAKRRFFFFFFFFFLWSHWCFPAFTIPFPDSPTPVCSRTQKSDVSGPKVST